MATFTSFKSYAAALDKMKVPPRVMREMGTKMAEEAQKIATREASSDLGGDPMMSGWPKARLDTRVRKLPAGALIQPKGRLAAAGWTTATIGRNAHGGPGGGFLGPGINSRTGETNLRFRNSGGVIIRKRKAKRWNGVTRGKGTATRATAQFEKSAGKIAEVELKKHFRRSGVDVS